MASACTNVNGYPRLRLDIHADDLSIRPRLMQTHRCPAGATEQVEYPHGGGI